MRDQIKFGMIRSDEEFQSLVKFAASFEHNVGSDSIMPIYTIERGDQMLGYFNVLLHPIVAPSMHPSITTARDFYEAMLSVRNHFCMNSVDGKFPNGTCFFALPTDEIVKDSVFERCGFKNTKKELWQAIP